MNLAIDIGNSAVKFGWFQGHTLKRFISVPADRAAAVSFRLPADAARLTVKRTGICSVNPAITPALVRLARRQSDASPVILTPRKCGLSLKVNQPARVGTDRVVNGRAALELGRGAAVVVDIGTALTIDIISSRRQFLGGAILPGPTLWLKALASTALLPVSSFHPNAPLPGKHTHGAIRGGAAHGLVCAIDGIAGLLARKHHAKIVVLTGGWSRAFTHRLKVRHVHRPHLTLEGINIVLGEK